MSEETENTTTETEESEYTEITEEDIITDSETPSIEEILELWEDEQFMNLLKNELNITWSDQETDERVSRIVKNAQFTMNRKLGAEIDYLSNGQEQELFIAYCVYMWNNCANEFDIYYQNEILQLREYYEVKQWRDNNE